MNLTQFLLILRARYRVILLVMMSVVLAAIAISLILPKTYRATTSLVLNYKGQDPVTGLAASMQQMTGYMATQVDIVSSKSVALAVVDDLKLAESPEIKKQFIEDTEGNGSIRDWLSDLLLKKLVVDPARESSVLNITFIGTDPDFAAAVVNAFATAYQRISIQLKTEPAQKAASYFNNQIKTLRETFELSQNKLSKYQQINGISNSDNRLDVETSRLNELSSQLVIAQGQVMEATSRQRQASGSASDSPDVLNSPLIQNLKVSLSAAEAKFAELSQRLNVNHPQYVAAKSEIDKLRLNLNEQLRVASSGIAGNAKVYQQREAELKNALALQKAKVMSLNGARDELKILTNEMESAQRAYEAANARLTQTSFEGKSNQSEIAVLNPAFPPSEPAGPKLVRNTLVAIFLGGFFGVIVATLRELMDKRVRSEADLAGFPVLVVLEKISKTTRRKEAKVKKFRLQRLAKSNRGYSS